MMPATPQRGPTVGAFINTPAPNRPGLLRQSSAQQQQLQQQVAPAAAPTLTPIERAARTVNSMLDQDASYRDLDTYLGQGVSGEYAMASSPAWTPFEEIKKYRIPDRILEQINMTQMVTEMGLFAEINHAWVTIDNQLYLWDYTNPTPELIGYEEQQNTIRSVKLVKPRPKVFVADISYLLVVATTADVFLIAVQCERGPEGVHSVTLFRTGLSVTVKGIAVEAIAGSKTGRIFFADGRDSEDVYELNYQQEDKWFQSKCSKTNHVTKTTLPFPALSFKTVVRAYVVRMEVDDTRGVLYTLSSNGTIRVFHMKTPTSLDLVITKPLSQTMAMCSHIVPQRADALGRMEIVGIDTVSAAEASHMSLIATTSTGCRIFLSTTSGGYANDSSAPPTSMQVRHIRFPPPDTRNYNASPSTQLQPYQAASPIGYDSKFFTATVRAHRYAPGSTFFFVSKSANDNTHYLYLTAPSGQTSSQQDQIANPRYKEDAQELELTGRVQDVGLVTEPFSASNRPLGFGNELAVQFDKPLCEFAIMTHTGIQTVRRRRLVDIFAAIIKSGGGPEGIEGDLRKILRLYGRAETAATALAVACAQGSDVGADSRVAQVSDPDVLDMARKAFVQYGGKPQLNENATVEALNVDNVRPSPRHDGIAIYISRLVRSIWRSPIIGEVRTPTGTMLQPTHQVSKLRDIQKALIVLQEFMESNRQHIEGLAGPEAMSRASSRQEEVESQGENRALTSLLHLVNNIVEGIAFVLVMFEERLEDILALLPSDSQARVRQLTFEGLFSTAEGKNLARDLVKAIVSRNIAKGSNVETVAEALRRKCGSFCSSDDVVIFKAQESLKKATDLGANNERGRMMLNDSLKLFEQVAKSLSEEHLSQAVDNYIALEFYAGAIRIALKVAQELDRGNKALSWIKDGRPSPDAREEYYAKRTSCYTLIFQVIEAVDQAHDSQSTVPEGVVSKIAKRRQEAYEQINESEDEVFQNYLYDWYIQQGWPDRLLEIQSPFVVDYLRRSSSSNLAHADLLWRYYAHYNDFLSAAEVQFELAKSEFDLKLEKRIEYLSRAKANASTRVTGLLDAGMRNRQSRQQLLRNITDHLDIANIQDDVLQKIRNEDTARVSEERKRDIVNTLDGKIMSLDDLFHNYCDKAGYYDLSLLIFHAADFRGVPEIRSTWSNIIEQAHRKAVEEGTTAWENVSLVVETLGRRVNMNENIFPVNIVLQLLLEYHLTTYTTNANEPALITSARNTEALLYISPDRITWPLDTLIQLNAPFEYLVASLESFWYSHEHPFDTTRNKKELTKYIIYTTEAWANVSVRSGLPFGGEENSLGLSELLKLVTEEGVLSRDGGEEGQWLERGRVVRVLVDRVVSGDGGLGLSTSRRA